MQDEQQVKGAAGQLALGKRDDLARSNTTDAEIVGDAEASDVHDGQATSLEPRHNSLIQLVDVRREHGDTPRTFSLDSGSHSIVRADDRCARFAGNVEDELGFSFRGMSGNRRSKVSSSWFRF